MKKRFLIIGVLLLSSLGHSTTHCLSAIDGVTQEVKKDQDSKSVYDERNEWIKTRKNELIALISELVNMNDFPKTNIENEKDKLKLKIRMYVKDIKDVDYADDKKFEGIKAKFDSLESYIRSTPARLRLRENMKR
ncbi:MAG: hypothetical protein V4497_12095 [Bacteroidota bacterium]